MGWVRVRARVDEDRERREAAAQVDGGGVGAVDRRAVLRRHDATKCTERRRVGEGLARVRARVRVRVRLRLRLRLRVRVRIRVRVRVIGDLGPAALTLTLIFLTLTLTLTPTSSVTWDQQPTDRLVIALESVNAVCVPA